MEKATFDTMRHAFQHEPDLHILSIEKIRLPLNSRDELPPILAGLQWIWTHPTLKAEILVLGVVRLCLDADWDRMEHVANYDTLVRQKLGVPATPWGEDAKVFGHQTLRDNIALLETDVHFPTDPSLLWDAGRKCVILIEGLLASSHAAARVAEVQVVAAAAQGLARIFHTA